MAKVGEGDSRWIVSHRADGKNVDNWHWTEKDIFPWCQNSFETQFKNVKVPSQKADITIETTESVQGSMCICNRKGKTFYVFTVQLKLTWSGKLLDNPEITVKGTINVDDIANDEEKWKWTVKMENETSQNRPIKEEVQTNVGPILDKVINNVLEEMKSNNSIQYQQEPRSSSPTPPSTTTTTTTTTTQTKPSNQTGSSSRLITTPTSSSSSSSSSSLSTKSFTQKLTFEVPPHILYETLLDQNRVSAFTGGNAQVENKVSSNFSLFDGAVQGIQVELIPGKKIVQKWRFKTWPSDHFSNVTFSFEPDGNGTLLTLTQKEIPSSDYDRTCSGWETFFWQRIRGLFGWMYNLK